MKMSENNDYIQLPPLKKDTPSDVVAFMWEYMKVPEDSREKVKNLLKDTNENGVKISHGPGRRRGRRYGRICRGNIYARY